jgi:hypothetical protein|tara:strand:- start:13623 stop:14117 length:495 start_codon:yes stop_codon:yes gene_type:complete
MTAGMRASDSGTASGDIRKTSRWVFVFLAILWLGLILGVSFLATPVKFSAPSLTLPVALDVGRVTFSLFSRIEMILAALFIVLSWRRGVPKLQISFSLVLAMAVAAQALWLLPALTERVDMIARGEVPPPSGGHHIVYVCIEGGKAVILAILGFVGLMNMDHVT